MHDVAALHSRRASSSHATFRAPRATRGGAHVRDEELMSRAIELARSARRRTAPKPAVGCVIARDGEIVGEGATEATQTGAHAEVAALRDAGDRARGATAYSTLEPCNHQGNTPPCTEALIAAGVARVVVAVGDPDERVAGTGFARFRAAGIEVVDGCRRARRRPRPRAVPASPPYRSGVRHRQDRDEPRRPRRGRRRHVAVDHVARRHTPTRTSCAPTRRRSSSAPGPRSPIIPR